jgi:hypothetical protein
MPCDQGRDHPKTEAFCETAHFLPEECPGPTVSSGPSGLTMPVEVQVLSSAARGKDLRRRGVSPFSMHAPETEAGRERACPGVGLSSRATMAASAWAESSNSARSAAVPPPRRQAPTPFPRCQSPGPLGRPGLNTAPTEFLLRHTDEIEANLHRCEVEAREVRQRIESAQSPRPNLRATVIARARSGPREQVHAPAD